MYVIEPTNPKKPARKIIINSENVIYEPSYLWKLIDKHKIEKLEDLYIILNDIDENDRNVAVIPSLPKNVKIGDEFRKKDCLPYKINYAQFDIDGFTPRSTRPSEMETPLDVFTRIRRELPFIKDDTGVVIQASNKFGIEGYEDEVKLRIYVMLDRDYHQDSLYKIFIDNGVYDHKIYIKSIAWLVRPPELINTKRLYHGKRTFIIDGEPVKLDEISTSVSTSRNTGESYIDHRPKPPSWWNLRHELGWYEWKTATEAIWWLQEVLYEEGHLEHNRHTTNWHLLERYMHLNFSLGDRLIEEMSTSPHLLGETNFEDERNYILEKTHEYANRKNLKDCFEEDEIIELDTLILDDELNIRELIDFKKKIIAIKSGCGTGKTVIQKQIKSLIEASKPEWNGLYATTLKSVLESICKHTGMTYYLEGGEDREAKKYTAKQAKWLATTDLSLHFDDEVHRNVLIFDEIERVIANSHGEHPNNIDYLFDRALQADLLIFLDADMSYDRTGWFIEELCRRSRHHKQLVINTRDYAKGMEFNLLKNNEHAMMVALRKIKEGVFVDIHVDYSDKEEANHKITAMVKTLEMLSGKRGIGHDSNSVPEDLKRNPQQYLTNAIQNEDLAFMVRSPFALIGWSLVLDFVDCVTIGLYTGMHISPIDMFQAQRRIRNIREHYILLPKVPWEWIEGEGYIKKLAENFETVEASSERERKIKAKSLTLADIHHSKAMMIYCSQVNHLGGILRTHIKDLETDKEIKDLFKKEKDLNKEEKIQRYIHPPRNKELAHEFVNLSHIDINEDNVEEFLDRVDKFDEKRVNALLLMFYADENERRAWNNYASLQFGYLYGKLLDIILAKQHFKTEGDFLDFLRGDNRVITGYWDKEHQEELINLMRDNYIALKRDIRGLTNQNQKNPGEVIKMVLKMFDVGVKVKTPYYKLGIELWKYYQTKGLRMTWKYDKKIEWISNHIHDKINRRIPITERDEAFLIKKEDIVIAKITKPLYPLRALDNAIFWT